MYYLESPFRHDVTRKWLQSRRPETTLETSVPNKTTLETSEQNKTTLETSEQNKTTLETSVVDEVKRFNEEIIDSLEFLFTQLDHLECDLQSLRFFFTRLKCSFHLHSFRV